MLQQLSQDEIQRFMEFDYAETKDLCKHFLTTAAVILTFSVTFSEKIVNFATASIRDRNRLFRAWALLMISIVCAGTALTVMALAAHSARYGYFLSFTIHPYTLQRVAFAAIVLAGIAFVVGMFLLLLTGAKAVSRRMEAAGANPRGRP